MTARVVIQMTQIWGSWYPSDGIMSYTIYKNWSPSVVRTTIVQIPYRMRMLYEYTAKNTKNKCELDQLIGHGSTPGHGKRYALGNDPGTSTSYTTDTCSFLQAHSPLLLPPRLSLESRLTSVGIGDAYSSPPQIFAFGFSRDCRSTSFHGKPRYAHMKWNLGYVLAPVLPQQYGFSFDSSYENLARALNHFPVRWRPRYT
jgi:hypothetical protein